MAIQKKKTTVVAQKSKLIKPAPKKSVSAKKATVKKTAPSKVAAPKKKSSTSGKVVAKKPELKKAGGKNASVSKKAEKKSAPLKKVTSKKVAPAKKAASKLSFSKNTKPIIKSSPVKNAAKAGANKAVPKKLATPKNESVSKSAIAKKAPVIAKKVGKDDTKESASSQSTSGHKEELKKALSKVKDKNSTENNKTEKQKPFVMPKTNTEKSRKYEPEFTKSVLDQSPEEYTGPTMRYSDSELVEFRELITRKLETAKKELGYLQGLITRKDQLGGDDSDNRYMTMEDGSLSMEREQLSQMASRQITFIDHLEKAMMRIENKTYGICRVTGKLIDKARLRAVPHATLSIEAKMGIAK